MKNNNFNLQLLHHEEVFATREEALQYLSDYYKPFSLDAEPIVVKYGNERNPDVIFAIGTSNNAPGSYYAMDFTSVMDNLGEQSEIITDVDPSDTIVGTADNIAEAIDLLSKYVQSQKLSVEDTDSIDFDYAEDAEGGMKLKADLKVSKSGEDDDVDVNDNILGVKEDGIYAAVSLKYDELSHRLVFITSGYKNGRFQNDAKVERIDIGSHTSIDVDNDGKTVRLNVVESEDNKFTLDADVKISERENNILQKSDDKLFVNGVANNIAYGDGTVKGVIDEINETIEEIQNEISAVAGETIEGGTTDTAVVNVAELPNGGSRVTTNVRLGSNDSIMIANGGLEVNVTIDVNKTNNTLIMTVGNTTITKELPGVELIDHIEYDPVNKDIVIVYNENRSVTIPVSDIVKQFIFVNGNDDTHTVHFDVVDNGDGSSNVSALVKIDTSNDNILTFGTNGLFVSESDIDNKVAVENQRALAAEGVLQSSINDLASTVGDNYDALDDAIDEVAESVVTERERAIEAENAIRTTADNASDDVAQAMDDLQDVQSQLTQAVTDLSLAEQKLTTLEQTVASSTTAISSLSSQLTSEVNRSTNKDTELEGDIDDLEASVASIVLVQDTTDNLKYYLKVNGADRGEIVIPQDGYFEDVSYDNINKCLVFTFITPQGTTTVKSVDISDLTDIYEAGDGLEIAQNTFSVKISEASESYLTVSDQGLKIQGIDALKFGVDSTDTVNLSLTRNAGEDESTLEANVKIKTIQDIDNPNIIKSDSNGIFANVTLNYDKATNILTFNNGYGNKQMELSNFGILQDAFYDAVNKQIVLIVKKDDQTTSRIEIDVTDLIDEWSVVNTNESAVRLTKTETEEDGILLSSDVKYDVLVPNLVSNDPVNIITVQDNHLFVDGDAIDSKIEEGTQVEVGGNTISLQDFVDNVVDTINGIASRLEALETLETRVQALEDALNTLIDFGEYQAPK